MTEVCTAGLIRGAVTRLIFLYWMDWHVQFLQRGKKVVRLVLNCGEDNAHEAECGKL